MTDEIYKKEILAVKQLGEQIGYGNMMDIASILWAAVLISEGQPDSGAFYPTIDINMKKSKLTKTAREDRLRKLRFYRELGVISDD